jgi:hypothetical protein
MAQFGSSWMMALGQFDVVYVAQMLTVHTSLHWPVFTYTLLVCNINVLIPITISRKRIQRVKCTAIRSHLSITIKEWEVLDICNLFCGIVCYSYITTFSLDMKAKTSCQFQPWNRSYSQEIQTNQDLVANGWARDCLRGRKESWKEIDCP